MRKIRKQKAVMTMISASILTLFLVSLSPLPQNFAAAAASSGNATLDTVQVSIQPTNITAVSSYSVVAYNSTGTPVASYTGQYPQVTFELPSGTYLLAANANGPSPSKSPICYASSQSEQVTTGAGVASPPGQVVNSGSSSGPAIISPCYYPNQPAEYGYSFTQVSSSSTTAVITTESPSAIPTADVSVTVSYKNGTSVSDAYVSADVVGGNGYWDEISGASMYAQTGADGVAHLVIPDVPTIVTASNSIQVNLPENQTSTQVNVGGQLVNVTVYYSPSYVYESATALLIPPQTSLNMVVTAQPTYPLIPYGAGSSAPGQSVPPSSVVTVSPGSPQGAIIGDVQSNGNSAQTSQITAIPPLPPTSSLGAPVSARPSSSVPASTDMLAIGVLALAGAIAAMVGIAISRRRD